LKHPDTAVGDDRYSSVRHKGSRFGDAFRRPMRWLMIVLIVSVCALVAVSGGLALHVWRQHKRPAGLSGTSVREEGDVEPEETP